MTLLVVDRTGSYALAGLVTGAQTTAMALLAPYGSRLADRWGQSRTLLLVAAHATTLLLVAAITAVWPPATWVVIAGAAGACLPMVGLMVHAR